MKLSRITHRSRWAVLGCTLLAVAATGCQTNVGGQTLPSAFYLRDDVQFYPAGPEDKLPNLRRALEQYKLDQQTIEEGLGADGP